MDTLRELKEDGKLPVVKGLQQSFEQNIPKKPNSSKGEGHTKGHVEMSREADADTMRKPGGMFEEDRGHGVDSGDSPAESTGKGITQAETKSNIWKSQQDNRAKYNTHGNTATDKCDGEGIANTHPYIRRRSNDYEEISDIEMKAVKDTKRVHQTNQSDRDQSTERSHYQDDKPDEPDNTNGTVKGSSNANTVVGRLAENDEQYAKQYSRRMSSEDGRRKGCRETSSLLDMEQTHSGAVNETEESEESGSSNDDAFTGNTRNEAEVDSSPVTIRSNPMNRHDRPTTSFYMQLAKEMDDQISRDESSFENINIKCRPLVVAELYEALVNGEWLSAKGEMDDKQKWDEADKLNFLCQVLETALTAACEMKSQFDQRLHGLLLQPFADDKSSKTIENPPLSDQIRFSTSDFLRKQAERVDIDPLKQKVITALKSTKVFQKLSSKKILDKGKKHLHEYVKACSTLTWMMVIQRPQMTFRLGEIGKQYDASTHKVNFASADPSHPNARIQLNVHPAMYHGDKLMSKGEVKLINDTQ